MSGDYPSHRWIFCGPAANSKPSELTDIPERYERLENCRWSELSAAYKLWKEGPQTDIVGMCHYRRLFCFNKPSTDLLIQIRRTDLHRAMNIDVHSILSSMVGQRTIVAPLFFKLSTPIALHYARMHDWQDYVRGMAACIRLFPHLAPFIAAQLFQRKLYPFNIFIMNWNDSDELCHVWFDTLIDLSKKTNWPREDPYQDRDMAYLAERLTDAWLRYKRAQGYRIVQLPLFFVSD